MEIERKFYLPSIPAMVLVDGVGIDQGYLVIENGEVRLRRKGDRFFLTVKGDGTLSREEWEVEIPQWVFLQLWAETDRKRVEKTRYLIGEIELDIYHGALTGLVVFEVEFDSEEVAAAFTLPDWADGAVEVTSNPAFKNKRLATHGMPTV